MRSKNKQYLLFLLLAYVMMTMHSVIPHAHHAYDAEHHAHQHDDHSHDHGDEDHHDQESLPHALAHFLHNAGEYEVFSRENAVPVIIKQTIAILPAMLSTSCSIEVSQNEISPPELYKYNPVPLIFRSPQGRKAPPVPFHV